MNCSKSILILRNIKLFGFCGIHAYEQQVMQTLYASLRLHADLKQAIETDDLQHTINYETIATILQDSMQKPAKLIEHLAYRLAHTLFDNFEQLNALQIQLTKPQALFNDKSSVSIKLSLVRSLSSVP